MTTSQTSADSNAGPGKLPTPRIQERTMSGVPGGPMFVLCVVLFVLAVVLLVGHLPAAGVPLLVIAVLAVTGFTPITPGQARVVQLFGRYVGTARTTGLRWFNPFTRRRPVSTRIRNHETGTTKVNDADGNPIEIAAVLVWQIHDTARALYEVDDFVQFVNTQAETAVRHIATSYPYDAGGEDRLSLRDNAEEITAKLSEEIALRIEPAGVSIVESRLTRLAYAPEIASAMLRRQQANAVVAARQRIVEGAVSMVQLALSRLDEQNVVALDDERRATMVSNLLVVLCGDRDIQPVVNTGSLYQ
jgi:regulator of protease activity HflC (stomatin/prohibitin superfamily)